MTQSKTMLAALLGALLGACSVGEVDLGGGGGGGPDSGNGGTDAPVGQAARDLCVNRGTPVAARNHTAAGAAPAGPRSGMNCMAAGCHGVGGTPQFGFAGTVYKANTGGAVNPGVIVRIFPETPREAAAVAIATTDDAGNFYYDGPALTAFPYVTDVTACGSDSGVGGIRPMQARLTTAANMNCNGGTACHQADVTTSLAIYLMD